MAPRRKRTAAKTTRPRRGKPKLPEGDFETSMTAEEQESKLNNYIEDYQLQVKAKVERMRKYIDTLKGLITNCYRSVMVEIPSSVKEMTMDGFMSKGGTVDAVFSAQVNATINGFVDDPAKALGVPSASRLPLSNVSNNIDITGLSLEQSSIMSQLTSNVQTAGKSTRKRKQVKVTEEKPPVSRTGTRSSRRLQAKSSVSVTNNEVTPMPNMNTLSVLQQAAFITPKFDPRLPIPSTVMRDPKAGERIISMSGSPLANPAGPGGVKAPQVFIPLTGGKTIQLSVDEKCPMNDEDIDVSNDSVAQQNIRLLQEKLSKLLKQPQLD